MARTKYQKPKAGKQSKQHHNRKRGGGKQDDVSELRAQLDALGLKIVQVTADGNCFFRALADQLEGDEDQHEKYRRVTVQFIKDNREMFEPFVEDEPFDDYCQSMAEDATWAGNIELQAASLATHSNICIHRHMYPRWYIQNFDKHQSRMVHISYHDGEHYNSVRTKDDTCSGPARPIIIKGEANLSVKPKQKIAASTKNDAENGRNVVADEYADSVEDVTRYEDSKQGGDADSADEALVAEKESLNSTSAEAEYSHSVRSSCDESPVENSEQTRSANTCNGDSGFAVGRSDTKKGFPSDEKKSISRNKSCPCGSKKKYKSCCGTVTSKTSARLLANQIVDECGKSTKNRKQVCRKGSNQPDGGPLDMGALCI